MANNVGSGGGGNRSGSRGGSKNGEAGTSFRRSMNQLMALG